MALARFKSVLVFALVAAHAGIARCAEPVDQFLTALRQRKLYDEAADYLQLLETQPSVADADKQRTAYEHGVTLVESAAGESDPKARDAQLARACEQFSVFIKRHPEHALIGSARAQLASLSIDRGRIEMQSAEQDKAEAARARARKQFEQAGAESKAAESVLDARLQKMPKLIPPSEKELQDQKQQIASELIQVRLLRPNAEYELARTFDAGSSQAKKHLQAAAQSYKGLYEAYRTRSAGLLARLWEGRCYQELGDFRQALGCYQELIDLPATPDTRAIQTKGVRQALECWTHGSQKKYQEAIECGERWEKESGQDRRDADALAIRYLTAVAYESQSKTLPAKDPNRKKLAGYARQFVGTVADQPGEYQQPAKMLLVALAKGKKQEKDSGAKSKTFAEVFEQANGVLRQVEEAAAGLQAARQKGDDAQVKKLEKQKQEAAAATVALLQKALNQSDAKTSLDDVNAARWYLCYFAWDRGDDYEAAVLGEFLARHYPDSEAGRKGAKVALAAFVRLYSNAKQADKSFEVNQIERMAALIFKQWPDREESEEAALTMLNFAVSRRQLDKAVEYLAKISNNSPRRGQAELRAGQALWSAYLRSLQASDNERPSEDELEALKKRAQEILAQGIARMEKAGDVDATLAAAVLALAQICVETGQVEQAIAWLENPKMGPLTLIKAGSPAATREAFVTETYKLALRAYIAVSPQQLKKAEEVMDSLEKQVQKNPDATSGINLAAIYISLGRELQQHLQALRKSGKNKELDTVSKAFDVFLDRLMKRETGASYASFNWVGETYFNLATSFEEGGGPPSLKAPGFFKKAAAGYQRMLETAEKDPKLSKQPDTLNAIRSRMSDCHRRAGEYEQAIKAIVPVLREKPMFLSAQVQAAETYQAEGAIKPASYALAINGGEPGKDGKNVIWGWGKISKMTVNNPKFSPIFHQSRLNIVEARYNYAAVEKDPAKKAKVLETAKQDLWFTYKLHPELGGNETARRYDDLLKQIQKSLGNPETGLKEFKDRDAAEAAAASTAN
jgi:hypothetical protein